MNGVLRSKQLFSVCKGGRLFASFPFLDVHWSYNLGARTQWHRKFQFYFGEPVEGGTKRTKRDVHKTFLLTDESLMTKETIFQAVVKGILYVC